MVEVEILRRRVGVLLSVRLSRPQLTLPITHSHAVTHTYTLRRVIKFRVNKTNLEHSLEKAQDKQDITSSTS